MLLETSKRVSSIPSGELPNFHFQSDLDASRVCRKAQRETADYSFRSSNAFSYAWSALSDTSLSDISMISVVALPLMGDDITNMHPTLSS